MGLAILGVVVLLYILLAYFAAKTWQVWHVVLLVFLFLFTGGFLILSAATMKVQERHRSRYEQLGQQIKSETDSNALLKFGSRQAGQQGEIELRGEVQRTLVDRGRVWRNLRLTDLGDNQVVLDTANWTSGCVAVAGPDEDEMPMDEPPVDGGAEPAGEAAAGTSLGLQEDTVVYAFKELPLANVPPGVRDVLLAGNTMDSVETLGPCRVPGAYLGEFRVVGDPAANGNQLTLTPTMQLSESQIQQLEDAEGSWALYETMPVDSHDAFEGLSLEQIGVLLSAVNLAPDVATNVAQEYARDQQAATAADPPERKWVRVRFKQGHTEDVDLNVDVAAAEGAPLPDRVFDPSGRSVVPTLSQGEQTSFQEGDEAVFDWQTAQSLIDSGKAELVEEVYNRRLRDYARDFRSFFSRMEGLDRLVGLAETDVQKLEDSIKHLQSQIAFQSQQRADLEHDLNGLNQEQEVLTAYGAALDGAWQQLRADLSRLYRTNRQLVSRMTSDR